MGQIPWAELGLTIKTPRGVYALNLAGPIDRSSGALVLTLNLERADGVERVAFRCRVAASLLAPASGVEAETAILEALARWLTREFEQTREAALKSIRTERRLFEIAFDENQRGPF